MQIFAQIFYIKQKDSHRCESLFGGATENRTRDTRIFSPLLYQLSYGTSRELWLNTNRDYIAHMNFRHALALRSANTSLVYVPREPCGVLDFRKAGAKVMLFFDIHKFFCIFLAFLAKKV